METPKNRAGALTETIMDGIREHLKETVNYGAPPNVHHYNRAWEHVYAVLSLALSEK